MSRTITIDLDRIDRDVYFDRPAVPEISEADTRLIDAIWASIEDQGREYIYPKQVEKGKADEYHSVTGQCVYSKPDNTPACVIGHAIFRLDPEGLPGHDFIGGASMVLVDWAQDFSQWALIFADNVQSSQDDYQPWGQAWDDAVENAATQYGVVIA